MNRLKPSWVSQRKFSTQYSKRKILTVPVKGELLSGYYPVRLALENNRRTIYKIFFNPKSSRITDEVVSMAESKNISCQEASWKTLDKLSHHASHKGVCADVSPLTPEAGDQCAEEIISKTKQLWLLMTSIGDPQNMGAIIRSAYFLGVDQIFTTSPHDARQASSSFTPTVSRASAGTLEIFTPKVIYRPENFLQSLNDQAWSVIGTYGEHQNQPVVKSIHGDNTILIVGNEGEGLPPSISNKCNQILTISPNRRLHSCVDSLNVSVATALLIQRLRSSST